MCERRGSKAVEGGLHAAFGRGFWFYMLGGAYTYGAMVPFWFIGAKHIALKWKLPLKEVWSSRHPPPLLTSTPPPYTIQLPCPSTTPLHFTNVCAYVCVTCRNFYPERELHERE